MHFIGHYFHYDSKFWKTMKALWLAPGELTREYWEGKRARSIAPVSLYIFISAVFFIISFSFDIGGRQDKEAASPQEIQHARQRAAARDSVAAAHPTRARAFTKSLRDKMARIDAISDTGTGAELNERFGHNVPKLFFFMIPVMAAVLRLLFIRRNTTRFTHHAIFSLHIHSFFFSLFLLSVINPFTAIDTALNCVLMAVFLVYFVVAVRRAYGVSYGRAVLNTLTVALTYSVLFFLSFLTLTLYLLRDV